MLKHVKNRRYPRVHISIDQRMQRSQRDEGKGRRHVKRPHRRKIRKTKENVQIRISYLGFLFLFYLM